MGRHFKNNATGGGCSERVTTKRLKKPVAALVALVATCVVAVSAYATVPAVRNAVDTVRDNLVAAVTGSNAAQTRAVGDTVENSAVADRDSTNDWNTVLTQDGQVSTQNIGRIWTDKSVFTDSYKFQGSIEDTITKAKGSDFLVGLSALSSTSNLKTVTTTTTPLDIVLVLDVSGSMDDPMGGAYTETYSISTNRSYYVNVDGEWHEVEYSRRQGWYYQTGFGMWAETHYVTPKTSASDSNPDHVQFYTYQTVSKMDSLKSAANQFIDSVNTMNEAIPEGGEQHRIAIVKYADDSYHYTIGNNRGAGGNGEYNYTQVMSDFSTNAADLKDGIDSINAGGATASDYGLTMAQHVFDGGTYEAGRYDDNEGSGTYVGARAEAKKVLIFFTDGQPNHSSGWSDSVAATSVNLAHDMKAAGTTIYTIGVVDGANPDNTTTNLNRYLHGVSSNYKDATATGWWGDADWGSLDLGTRTPAPEGSTEVPQYYYAAEDAAQLDQVFQDITTSIGQDNASGSPIEDVTTEGETNPGNLTFNDELGAYMEVAGNTMQIVYADQTFTSGNRTSQNIEGGVVYTYPFSGTVHANEAYGDRVANLSGLQIKVTHYDDPAKGDLVEAVIPADLIPMRNYEVDTENGTMTVSSTYPVRLFYSVQVKAEAAEQLADPSSAIYTSDYVKNNTNEDGTGVEFYSNLYTNSNGDGFVGDTTATFKPSNGNRFYYFTANTPLYTSNDGSDAQADRSFINGDNTVYYKDTYWVQTDKTVEDPETGEQIPVAEEKTEYIPLSTSDIRDSVKYTASGAYLPPQTHNEDKIDDLYAVKGDDGNPTETAKDTLNPTWTVIQDDNGDNVSVISARMGNNGRLALELPGTLAVSKNVAFGDQYGNTGFDASAYTQKKDYAINITLTGEDNRPVSGTYKAQVKNAQGAVVSNPTNGYFDITFTNGKATQSIKHGETLYIYGLDAGATYEVTETAPGDGFTTAYDDNAKGTIEINKTSSTTVTNTYTLQSTELTGSTDLKVSKTLSNRDWREGDSFTFRIAAGQSTPNAPMPEKTTVTIDSTNKDAGASFGNISYSTPGQYVYIISEVVPTEDALTGVTYSRARYRVLVDVEDNGDGTMTATSTMTQIMDDAGTNVENGPAIETHTAAFTNTYRTSDEGGTANLGGTKRFTDATGATELADWTFDFTLTAVGGYPSDEKPGEPGAGETVYPISAADVPMPADAQGTSKTVTLSGGAQVFNFGEMTYDGNDVDKTYVYAITEVAGDNDKMTYDGDTEYVTVTVTEAQDGNVAVINAIANRNAADVVFENSYTPESAKLAGDTALGGTKTITGRDMVEGESYDFTLEYTDGVDGTTPAEDSWIVLPDADDMTARVTGAQKGDKTAFTFGDITFNHVGVYTFTISENVPTGEDALGGMTYDNHKCTVTVDVTYDKDNNRLVASTDYGTFDNRASNEFVNEYESSFNYGTTTAGGLNVSKTLTGRDMLDGEFSFTITAANVEGNPALTDNKLAEADENFSNGGANDGVANVMSKLRGITFDQDDAGKTFIYTVAETKGDLANVDYDANVYTVEIKVVDDNDGTMHTETTVKNADGEQVGEVATWDDQATEGSTVATVAFKNTYTPDEAELTEGTDTGLKVTKKVTGAPTDADFNFTLVLTGQPEGSKVGGVTEDGEGNMIATTKVDHNFTADEVAAGTTAEALFGTLTFDKAGTYTFDVIENEAQGEGAEDNWPAGWKYDTSTRQYTVVVTDENPAHAEDEGQPLYDGKLHIQSVNPSSRNQTFTNSYDHGTVTIGGDAEEALTVEKTVKGWSTDADFHFTFTPVEEEGVDWSTIEIANGADKTTVTENFADGDTHSAQFGEITFTKPGTYKFNVTEDEAHDETADPAGWTYDDSTQTITVIVSETDADGNYDGKLHATVDGPAKFENTYKAGTATVEGGEANFAGTKMIDGRDWLDSETFGFELTKGDVSERASWDNVTYLPVDAAEDAEPVAFESATATANEKNDKNGTFWFAGTYLFSEPGTYTFNVTEKQHNGDALPEKGAEPVNGMTYDRHVGTITVEVTDNGSGTLQAKVTPGTDDASVEFVNTFEGKPYTFGLEADEMLSGHKTVEDNVGSFQMADDQFTFVMRAQAEANPMPDNLTVETDTNGYKVVSVKNTNTDAQAYTADYSFGSITFDHDDLAGVTDDDNDGKISKAFQYNVYENETDMPAGVSAVNPGCTYTVTITVTEDLATGEITAEGEAVLVNPGDAENDPATLGSLDFVNKYDAGTITGGIQIYKTLSGRNWQQGDTFTFDVTMKADGVAKDDLPEFNFDNLAGTVADYTEADGELSYNITINPSRSATGNSYAFGTGIPTYTHEGTYVYTITERDSTVAGVTKDSSTYVVTVVIEDVEQGGEHVLNRTATIERDGVPYENTGRVDFTNTYTAAGTLDGATVLDVQKTFTGRENNEWTDNDVFTFKLTGSEGAPMPKNDQGDVVDTITLTKNELADGVATGSFGDIAYGNADRGKSYTYTITEVAGNVYGVDYSEAEYKVTVTVNDKATPDGTLVIVSTVEKTKDDNGAAVDPASAANVAAFTNTYKVNDDTKTVDRVDEDVKTDVDGKLVGVGDTLEYTIHWVNDAINETGVAQDATVTVVDKLPAGVTLDQDSIGEGVYDADAGTITWTINAKAAQEGDITYSVTVNDEALQTDELTNTAQVTVGDNNPHQSVETTVHVPQKSVENDREDADAGDLKVGDTLTYTIEYTNDADEPATITVTDPVPAGLTVTQDDIQDGGTLADGTITWVIENVPAGQSGEVHFSGVVNETALAEGANNQATIEVGEDGPVIKTNTVPGTLKTGTMSISKTVQVDEAEGTEIDTKKLFEFTVNLTDTKDNALTGTYAIEGAFDKDGNALTSVTDGTKVYLHHGDSATVKGLPAGTQVKVTETVPDGYTADRAERTGAIIADANTLFAFTNTYSTDPGTVSEGTESAFNLTKQLTGRDENNSWAAGDEFTFTLTPGTATDLEGNPVEDLTVPMPADSADGIKKVTVGAVKAGENGVAPIDFGEISYERTGIYTYTVQETGADGELGTGGYADGITYDGRTVNIRVTVTDNGTGGLVAAVEKTDEAVPATDDVAAVSFQNTYNSTFDYGANGQGGIDITKMLQNRDMTEGQFTFKVTAADELAAGKIGGQTVELKSAAAAADTAQSVIGNPFGNVTFDRADSGKTFTYTIEETGTAPDGYTYDSDVFTVEITPDDKGDGTMSVTTDVSSKNGYSQTVTSTAADPQKATVSFVNTYDAGDVTVGANGDATIVATKTLKNDDIAEYDGEFTFKVTSGDTEVATGSNNADGSITFDTITYTSENLYAAAHGGSDEVGTASLATEGDEDVYTFVYSVSEDEPTADGVSITNGKGSVTITVTDDRAGKLSIDVDYGSDANGLEFVNTYGTGEAAEVTLGGNKTLTGIDGAVAPALESGMFEFTITGKDGAPMPETTKVTNEGSAISFGPIKYTMENVFGTDTADETTVTEDDAAEQTDEAVETEGAELEGEATEVETTDEAATESETTDEVVAGEAAPAEDEGIELYTAGRTKTFTYTISETHAGDTIKGITYDGSSKTVKVTVTDNGDGTVSAAVTADTDADENMDFTFDNTYSVTPEESTPTGEGALTFTKVWDRQGGSRELAAGDFTFQLVSKADPETVYTATNDADGNVAFESITFDRAGDYTYTLSEVVPEDATPVDGGYEKDGVLYLNTSYTVTAHVTDNHDGTLSVEWTMTDADGADATTATFVNTYFVEGTSVTFGAAKALEGRAVKDGEFTFELRDAEGNVLGTATNDETGQIVFADAVQSFGSVGEYDFVIAEVLPEDDDATTEGIQKDGVTYDETTYTAHVVVSDDNKGKLYVSELTYNGEAALPTFKNSYEEPKEPVTPEKPAKPEENIPQTGDNTIAMVGGCALAAMALIGGGIFLRRRNSDQQ
ncbi:Spy0128 family protein [Collinsella tanakaei]|uniref:Spy0128 family protein n=1 Tax=Collinsella tanakaei TaxID=626935 RepID=UPI0025A45711|nr:FctA domain-containing protein [Collinsella tanakaei]MDM8299496.1 FctA domain-containing protein [Collinsella tanakaei]